MKKLNKALTLVMRPLLIVVACTTIAFLYAFYYTSDKVENYQMGILTSRVKNIGQSLAKAREKMKHVTKMVDSEQTHMADYINNRESINIANELKWITTTTGLSGFIITDKDGYVISSSHDGINMGKLNKIITETFENGIILGCGDFLEGLICTYTCNSIHDKNGDVVGAVIVIGFVANDRESIMTIRQEHGVHASLFRDGRCINSTYDINFEEIKLQSEALDTCMNNHNIWYGKGYLRGELGYEACMPLRDYDGSTKGIMKLRVEKTVVNTITEDISYILIVVWIVVTIIIFILLYSVNKRIVKPLVSIVKDVKVVATGDLTVDIKRSDSCMEIDELASEVDTMIEKIHSVIQPIVETSKEVVGSILQLSNASMNMSNSANRQAASLEEISSSMEEMGANVQQNTDNSVQTNTLAEDINTMIDEMGTSTSNSYEAIRNIANDVNAINELVMQTNILALNASVEAARAGEHGKGFAIVAKEVGRLADQTHETADGINQTANSSITEAEKAYNYANELLPKINHVAGLIKEITAASIEQNAGINQVNAAINDLNRVTQENAAGAEQIAASAQELQRMLEDMTKAINTFKVK
ncbi:MAG: methyl-accepting chemotaxis protein [Bacteroidales bacterium]|nr:methyl-accepting chemotaxis protein [Bacteroidales bacterium]